jgi:hypothetical protein
LGEENIKEYIVYGPVVEQGIWRIRNNQELRELCKDLDIAADIKSNRLEWLGHLVRMDYGRVVKISVSELERRRKRRRRKRRRRIRSERPSLRLLEDVEKDLREIKFKS